MTPTLDHLVIMASDLEASAAHYDNVLVALGFTRTREWVWMSPGGFAIDLKQAEEEGPYKRRGPGLNHIGLAVDTAEAFAAARAALSEAGIGLPPVQHFSDGRAFFLPDPDGLRLELSYDTTVT